MISEARARAIVRVFPRRRILVVGDVMLDRYVRGTVSRISPEAPVPIVHVREEYARPGGAANVALNVRSLGGRVTVAGLVGRDAGARELRGLLDSGGLSTGGLVTCSGVRTIVKTRIVAERQQVARVDYEDSPQAVSRVIGAFADRVGTLMKGVDAVIIEDYGKGAVAQEVVDRILSIAQARGVKVGLDPNPAHDLELHGISLATPNYKESLAAAGLREPAHPVDPAVDATLAQASRLLMKKWDPDLLLITLGPHGMHIASKGRAPVLIPTRAREVFDVSGAGDTVIAAAMLALAAGATNLEAAALANYAGGVVVGKLGTATCLPEELFEAVRGDSAPAAPSGRGRRPAARTAGAGARRAKRRPSA